MAYKLGAAKRIEDEESGIVFLVRTPFGLAKRMEVVSRRFSKAAADFEKLPDGERKDEIEEELRVADFEMTEMLLECIVGWENVVGEDDEPIPYTRAALDAIDIGIVESISTRLRERGVQSVKEREAKNLR